MITADFVDRQFAERDVFATDGLDTSRSSQLKVSCRCRDGVVPFSEFSQVGEVDQGIRLWKHRRIALWLLENGRNFKLFLKADNVRETVYGKRADRTLVRSRKLMNGRGS